MKYTSTLLAVRNMEDSKRFYKEILGLDIVSDFGANVTLEGGVALKTIETWQEFIDNKNIQLHNNAVELYFEETEMDCFLEHLKQFDISYVHTVKEHSWGQRVVRFYDLDYHIIEVGEDMVMVVKRFAASGMTERQISERMDVPLDYIKDCLKSLNNKTN